MSAPTWTNRVAEWDLCCTITTTQPADYVGSATRRFCKGRSRSNSSETGVVNGVFYEGIVSVTPVQVSVDSQIFGGGKSATTNVTITLSRDASQWEKSDAVKEVNQLLSDFATAEKHGKNATVRIYAASPHEVISYSDDLVFQGYLNEGVKITRKTIELTATDPLSGLRKALPASTFGTSSLIEEGMRGEPIQIIYGDWSAPQDHYKIRVACLDTRFRHARGYFQVCQPNENGLKSIAGTVRYMIGNNASDTPGSDDVPFKDLPVSSSSASTGLIYTDHPALIRDRKHLYDPSDAFYVQSVKGNTDSSGNLIEHPVDILRDILTDENYLNLPEYYFDFDTFDAVKDDYFGDASQTRSRGIIRTANDFLTVIQEILVSSGLILYYEKNQYKLDMVKWFRTTEIDDEDITTIDQATNEMGITVEVGRPGAPFDAVTLEYRQKADNETELKASKTIGTLGSYDSEEKRIRAPWIHNDTHAYQVTDQYYKGFSCTPIKVNVSSFGVGMDAEIGKYVKIRESEADFGQILTNLDYENQPFQIVGYSIDFMSGISTIECLNKHSYVVPGYWTSVTAPDYDNSTAEEKKQQGYWTNADGECDPGEADSDESHWI